jgi:hypothetical protein
MVLGGVDLKNKDRNFDYLYDSSDYETWRATLDQATD